MQSISFDSRELVFLFVRLRQQHCCSPQVLREYATLLVGFPVLTYYTGNPVYDTTLLEVFI